MKKNLFLIFLLMGISFSGLTQSTKETNTEKPVKTEYLTIRVQYGLKTSGVTYKLNLDIGTSGQHSLSGAVTNKDGYVIIDGRDYKSDIDLINYLGRSGWKVLTTGNIQILNDSYYTYLMYKEY